jgi:hypothetical protein
MYLLASFGANSTQRQLSQRLCVDTGQTGGVDRSNRSTGDYGSRPITQAREEPRRS